MIERSVYTYPPANIYFNGYCCMKEPSRCPWCLGDEQYIAYHDEVWGRPVLDPRDLFAKLCLDGQQAGLSWITILKKWKNYEEAFDGFDPERVALFDAAKVETLMRNPGIVRNRLKVLSVIQNARSYLALGESGTDFAQFIWSFTGAKPLINRRHTLSEIPVASPESEAMSKALKKAGFTFVGPTICYAFMQAVGIVNDHLVECSSYQECMRLQKKI